MLFRVLILSLTCFPIAPSTIVTPAERADPFCTVHGGDGIYALGPQSRHYVACVNSKLVHHSCSAGSVYSQREGSCVPEARLPPLQQLSRNRLKMLLALTRFCNSGRKDGLYGAGDGSCQQDYILCWHEISLLSCPSLPNENTDTARYMPEIPTFYDLTTGVCKERSECPASQTSGYESLEELLLAKGMCEKTSSDGVFALGRCLQWFAKCQGGKASLQSCAPTKVFDNRTSSCVHDFACFRSSEQIQRFLLEARTPAKHLCNESDDFATIAGGACSALYYVCVGKVPIEQICSKSLHAFDGECRPIQTVDACFDLVFPNAKKSSVCVESGTRTGLVASGVCAQKYYKCEEYAAKKRWCAEAEVFSASAQKCVRRTRVLECYERPSVDAICGEVREGKLAAGACLQWYYICENNTPVVQWCGNADEVYDAASGRCARIAGCYGSTTTTTTTTVAPTGSNLCQTDGEHGAFYADPNDCRAYIRCNWKQVVRQQCPQGTGWSQALLTCDHLRNLPNC